MGARQDTGSHATHDERVLAAPSDPTMGEDYRVKPAGNRIDRHVAAQPPGQLIRQIQSTERMT